MTPHQRSKALLASAIFPGVGQFMVGQPVKAVVIQGLFIASLFYVVLGRPDLLPIGLIVPLTVWLYSILDLVLAR